MTAKHTKGPWGIIKGDAGPIIFSGDKGAMVAQAIRRITTVERDANARLIAAAPDLLEALQFVMTAHGEQLDTAFAQAQDAIAKATGEQK